MRAVRVDPARCQGHNRCRAIAPDVFDVDDLGQARVVGDGQISVDQEAKVDLARRNCPEQAITVETPQ
jgi:ferredoxin